MNRYRWVILGVGVGAQAAIAALRLGLPALAPVLRDDLALSIAQIGLLLAAVPAGILLTLVPWGLLADRVGERPVVAVGMTGAAIALGIAAMTTSALALGAALFVAGAFGASATGATGRAVMAWFPRTERGLALGVRQMGIPLGGGIAALTLPALALGGGLDAAFAALAAASLAAAVAAAAWLRDPPRGAPITAPGFSAPPPLRDRRLWRLGAGSALLIVGQSGMLGFLVLFLHDERGFSTAAAAAVLAGVQWAGGAARLVVGVRSDRRQLRVAPIRHIGMGAAALLLAAAALSAGPDWLLLPPLLAGAVLAMSWNGLSFTTAAELSGRARAGTAMSVQNWIVTVAGTATPALFGVFVAATAWPAGWALLALSQLGGVRVLAPLEPEEEERRDAREQRLAAQAPAPGPCEATLA